jgi:hypothetical protein
MRVTDAYSPGYELCCHSCQSSDPLSTEIDGLMSALGQKQTFREAILMSALPPILLQNSLIEEFLGLPI